MIDFVKQVRKKTMTWLDRLFGHFEKPIPARLPRKADHNSYGPFFILAPRCSSSADAVQKISHSVDRRKEAIWCMSLTVKSTTTCSRICSKELLPKLLSRKRSETCLVGVKRKIQACKCVSPFRMQLRLICAERSMSSNTVATEMFRANSWWDKFFQTTRQRSKVCRTQKTLPTFKDEATQRSSHCTRMETVKHVCDCDMHAEWNIFKCNIVQVCCEVGWPQPSHDSWPTVLWMRKNSLWFLTFACLTSFILFPEVLIDLAPNVSVGSRVLELQGCIFMLGAAFQTFS